MTAGSVPPGRAGGRVRAAPRRFPEELAARLRPVRELGAGGMGRVVLAEDLDLGRKVAVKLILGARAVKEAERMRREAEALARVDHPNVVRLYEAGVCSQGPYLITEYLEGRSLEHFPLGFDPLPVMLDLAGGLEAVHEAGMLHRDLKPANMFRTRDGRAVLIDFGLAFDPERTALTVTGAVVGTFYTLPPEVLRGDTWAPPGDWYGWGASLFYVLEQRYPYDRQQLLDWACDGVTPTLEWLRTPPEDPRRALVEACLAEDPEARPRSRRECRDILELGVVQAPAPPARPPVEAARPAPSSGGALAPVLASAVAASVLGFAARAYLVRPAPPPPPPTPVRGEVDPAARADRDLGAAASEDSAPWEAAHPAKVRRQLEARAPEAARDPHDWGHLLVACPALAEVERWLAAGGSFEQLSGEVLDGYRRVDAWAQQTGRLRPFAPYLLAAARRGKLEDLSELGSENVLKVARDQPPGSLEGWAAAAVRLLSEAEVALDELGAILDRTPRGRAPEGLRSTVRLRILLLSSSSVDNVVEQLATEPESRADLRAWSDRAAVIMEAGLYATWRAIHAAPEDLDLAWTLYRVLGRGRSLLPVTRALVAPAPYLGPPPAFPAVAFVRGSVERLIGQQRRDMGMTFTDLYGAPRLWESALTVLPGSKAARMLRSVALERVAEAWRSAGEPARLVPKLPELWAWLAASPGLGERRGTVTAFAWAILDAGPADGFQVDDLDRLLTALVELRDELEAAGDGRRRAEVAEVHQRLAARRAEWAR